MGATAYSEWYKQGQARYLPVGVHYNVNCKSLYVPEGYEAHIAEHADWPVAMIITAGTDADREFYHRLWGSMRAESMGRVEVKKVDYAIGDLAFIGGTHRWSNGQYEYRFGLPPTGADAYLNANSSFRNDSAGFVDVPANSVVKVYEDGGGQGAGLTFNTQGRHWLNSLGWDNRISSVQHTRDGFTEVGSTFGEVTNKRQLGKSIAAKRTYRNDSGSAGSFSVEVGTTHSSSFSFNWSVTAGVTISASVTATTGALPGGEVTAGIETSLSATTGQEKSVSAEQSLSDTITAELGPGESCTAELLVTEYEADVPVKQRLKNNRTGGIIERQGMVHAIYSTAEARLS